MKSKKHFTENILLIVTLFLFSNVSAIATERSNSAPANRYANLVARELTEKLRAELSDPTVEVKIGNLANREVSAAEADLKGQALAIVKDDKTELPLEFDAKVNLTSRRVAEISYKFVDVAPVVVTASAEDNLMKELMTKIGKDHQTTNVVIALDGFDAVRASSGETNYEGIGEVRIGDFEWSKIKFNVTINSQNKKATRVLYQVQK